MCKKRFQRHIAMNARKLKVFKIKITYLSTQIFAFFLQAGNVFSTFIIVTSDYLNTSNLVIIGNANLANAS